MTRREQADFKEIVASINIQMVLHHYGIDWLRRVGKDLRGRCPIHRGKRIDSFSVNVERSLFHCFSCQASGGVINFVARMENCTIREAGLKMKEWFLSTGSITQPVRAGVPRYDPDSSRPSQAEPAANQPLTFELRNIDPDHPYLASRGINQETAATFGVGYYSGAGIMNGRIVIPIHNGNGQLVAYAGRSINESQLRYRLPAGFRKSIEIFNLHRVTDQEVILVEGYFDCMRVWQSGWRSVVALMGCALSQRQEEIIAARFKKLTILLDGDQAGRLATGRIAGELTSKLQVQIINLHKGQQPDRLSARELSNLLIAQ